MGLLRAVDYSRSVRSIIHAPRQSATIHSVFRRAANITLDGGLLALVSAELPRMPNGVQLPPAEARALLRRLRPGMAIVVGDQALAIPACDCAIDLASAAVWEPRPNITRGSVRPADLARRALRLARLLADQPEQGGLGALAGPLLLGQPVPETPLAQLAFLALRALVAASQRLALDDVAAAARQLAGLGPGLTPAGDDALGGFAAVLALLGGRAAQHDQIAETIAAAAQPHTTTLSGVLLAHAARGEVAEHVGTLLRALATPCTDNATLTQATKGLLAHGATSGGDTLLGVLLGCGALEGEVDDDLHRS